MRYDKLSARVCNEFELDLNAFVDGELKDIDAKRVMKHLDACSHCQGYMEHLRKFARLHQACFNEEAILASFDAPQIFQNITSDLVDERIANVSELFYQIGKAYVARTIASGCTFKVGKSGKETRKVRLHMVKRPMALDKTRMKAGSLFREMNDMSEAGKGKNKRVTRAHSFFRKHRNKDTSDVDVGRRFLEESLAIDAEKPEPRIYLGIYFFVVRKNYTQAREQFRKVLALPGLSEEHRSHCLINLGLTFNTEYKYEEAMACFHDVVKSGVINRYPKLYRCLVLLAITYAKLGKFDRAISTFAETVKDFPKRIDEIRKELWEMRTFQTVVSSHPMFRKDLEERIPALFAS